MANSPNDKLGQLTQAVVGSTTYTYTYDFCGNITSANGKTYTYGNSQWKDLLTSYDGQTISYDGSGNPTNYYNGTSWTFGWAEGRNLVTASGNGKEISYTYDHEGVRTSKTVDGTVHNYIYASGKLLREIYDGTVIDFFYDANGRPYAMTQNGTTYYYVLNLQGDVLGVMDGSGNIVAKYKYDPYGNLLDTASIKADIYNPLRYRGYYYDTESNLYYLQSRYYDPAIGRFINADSYLSTGQGLIGNNMFSYCANSPVNFRDSSGYAIETVLDVASIAFSVVDFVGNPSWLNLGYLLWDVGAAIVPVVPGSYIAKGGKIAILVAGKIDDFADGAKFFTGSYNELKKLFKGVTGIEIHHLIEKRFVSLFSCKAGNFLSIPLTSEMHRVITNRWRNLHKVSDVFKDFAYGSNYSKITYDLMRKAVNEVYQDMPEILDDVLEWLEKNWKGKL